MTRPAEETNIHSRLLKCALEIEDSRAYWYKTDGTAKVTTQQAFDEYWFGARSLARVEVLLTNFRARFDKFPSAIKVLHHWANMQPSTRKLICHWHLQLSDPLYRAFSGNFLPNRRSDNRLEVTRDSVIGWVSENGGAHWTAATQIQFASKLLSCVYSAGLVGSNRDPRLLITPSVSDDALAYLIYLLRGIEFSGNLLNNPYLSSVGLIEKEMDARLRKLTGMDFRRQGRLVDFTFEFSDLEEWAQAQIFCSHFAEIGRA